MGLPSAALAQRTAPDSAAVVRLDSLDVTVLRRPASLARSPAALTVLDAARIQDGQFTAGLDEALVAVPGVLVNNRYNPSIGSRISIRGSGARAAFGVRGIRLIADGIPLTMPDGQSNLNNLDLGSADRIAVIRGPASTIHGNAAGGVIAINSETAPANGFSMQARAIAGDIDGASGGLTNHAKLQLKFAGRSERFDYIASLSRQDVDGYRAYSASRHTLLNLRGQFAPDARSRLTLTVNAVDQPVAESPGALPVDSLRRDPRMAWPNNVRTGSGEATRQVQAGLNYARTLGAGQLDLSVYGLTRDLDNALPFGFILLDRRAGGLRAAYSSQNTVGGRAATFTAGADIELLSDDRREFDNAGGEPGTQLRRDQVDAVTAIGPFVQAELQIAQAVSFSAGARYDAVRFETTDHFTGDARDDSGERTLRAFSPVAGIIVAATPALRVYANVATSFQTPTTTELINAPPATGQPCCPAGFNTQLEPQRATSFEAGVKGEFLDRIGYDVAVYHMSVRNTLVPFQVEQADGREFFRNAGESRHRGLEVGASGNLGRIGLSLAYTLSNFTFVDDGLDALDYEGNEVPGVPPHHLFAGVRLDAGRGVMLEADFDHLGAYFANDANTAVARNPSASVVDLRILFGSTLRGVSARPFLALNNLLDERYSSSVVVNAVGARYFEPAPGRNLAFGLTIGTGGWR